MVSSKDKTNNIEGDLENWLSKARKVVIAGLGNPLRKDDSVGINVVRGLQRKVSKNIYLIECETVPESYIEAITEFNPTHILVVDAAALDLKPGSAKLINPDQLANRPAISTHTLPLQVFCKYLAETTGAKIAILAIQPEDASFGGGLTKKVEKTAKHISHLLSNFLP
jgi:hydrogenase 3 maturation protease